MKLYLKASRHQYEANKALPASARTSAPPTAATAAAAAAVTVAVAAPLSSRRSVSPSLKSMPLSQQAMGRLIMQSRHRRQHAAAAVNSDETRTTVTHNDQPSQDTSVDSDRPVRRNGGGEMLRPTSNTPSNVSPNRMRSNNRPSKAVGVPFIIIVVILVFLYFTST